MGILPEALWILPEGCFIPPNREIGWLQLQDGTYGSCVAGAFLLPNKGGWTPIVSADAVKQENAKARTSTTMWTLEQLAKAPK